MAAMPRLLAESGRMGDAFPTTLATAALATAALATAAAHCRHRRLFLASTAISTAIAATTLDPSILTRPITIAFALTPSPLSPLPPPSSPHDHPRRRRVTTSSIASASVATAALTSAALTSSSVASTAVSSASAASAASAVKPTSSTAPLPARPHAPRVYMHMHTTLPAVCLR